MLEAIGVGSVDDLFADIPQEVRVSRELRLPEGLPEMAVARLVGHMAEANTSLDRLVSFLGAGAYERYVPAAVEALVGRSEFYTSYTPYQPEVSQGMLQVIYEFQSFVTALTGLDVAQASLYDGPSALAEAVLLSEAETRRRRVIVARSLDPQYREVLRTYAQGHELLVEEVPLDGDATDLEALRRALGDDVAAVVLQHPNFFGSLEDPAEVGRLAHEVGALFVAVVDPVSLAVLTPPGAYGADVAVGEGQSLGIPPSFGGPYLGFMAARRSLVRRLPGRIAGATVDVEGRRGYVLTLQAREQHIRREKATSNICTNQGLMALWVTVYLALLGPEGLRRVATLSLEGAHELAAGIGALPGWEVVNRRPFFQEFVVRGPLPARELVAQLRREGVLPGYPLGRVYPEFGEEALLVAVTERRTEGDRLRLLDLLRGRTPGR